SSIPRTVFGNDVTVVKVRVKATEKAAKSEIKEVAVPSGPTDSPMGLANDIENAEMYDTDNISNLIVE
ncbi:hypothetical protein, partial [Lysinibacillus xylanilyticus]|uniref:hypothetical protein n=1 Tax=Lysinibacillus xylanilyticus TaxID=582475 RepID=UPI00382B2C78